MLLDRLEYYRIWGVLKMWLESFLVGRHQFTNIKEQNSCKLSITHGVSQRSVVGSLLFLLYINVLYKAMQHSSIHHFADDKNLLYTRKSKKNDTHLSQNLKQLF